MKKTLTKLSAVLLAFLLMFGMIQNFAFADNAALQPDSGSLVIHKYLMDDISKAKAPNNGNEAGTADNPAVPSEAKPLGGIEFKIYKITIPVDGPNAGKYPADGVYTLDSKSAPTRLTDEGGLTFAVTAAAVPGVTTSGVQDATLGTATAADLPKGVYLVVEQENHLVDYPAAPFVVSVPMTDPSGTGWLTTVHCYPKNEKNIATKTPNETSVFVGQSVDWTIVSSIPVEIKTTQIFDVFDEMDPALTFVEGSVVVTSLAAEDADSGTLIPMSGNYTVSVNAFNQMTIRFTAAGRAILASNKYVKFVFSTVVNENILERTGNLIVNQAAIEFANDFTNEFGEEFSEYKEIDTTLAKIHTATVAIDKIDATTGKGVAGAKFQIASSEQNAKDGNYLRKLADGTVVDFGETNYGTATVWTETTVADANPDNPATATFKGLKDYVDGSPKVYKSYWLVEVEAPTGYNLLSAPVQVTFSATNSTEAGGYTLSQTIANTKGFTLPKTGGMGTIIFTVGGIVLIGAAVILFIVSGKKKRTSK